MLGDDLGTIHSIAAKTNLAVYTSHRPENFTEALMELSLYCDRQLPKTFNTVFSPLCFAITSKADLIVLGGEYGNVATLDVNTEKILRDEEICYKIPIVNLFLVLKDTQVALYNEASEIFLLEFPSLEALHKIELRPGRVLMVMNELDRRICYYNGGLKIKFIRLSEEYDYYTTTASDCQRLEIPSPAISIEISFNNLVLAVGTEDGRIMMYQISSCNLLKATQVSMVQATLLAFSEKDKFLASAYTDNTIRVWDIENSSFILRYHFQKHTNLITGLAFVRDNAYLVSSSLDSDIHLWDMKVEGLPYTLNYTDTQITVLKGFKDHKTVYYLQKNNTVSKWNVPGLHKSARYRGHSGPLISLQFLSETFELLSIGQDNLGIIWDYRNHLEVTRKKFKSSLVGMLLSKTSKFVFLISVKPLLYVWNFMSNTVDELEIAQPAVALALTENESVLAVTDVIYRIILYDYCTMERRIVIKGHVLPVSQIFFTCNDEFLITGSRDTTIGKWEVDNGLRVNSGIGHETSIVSLIVSKSEFIISAAEDGTVIIWNLNCISLYVIQAIEAYCNLGIYLSKSQEYLITLQGKVASFWQLETLALMFQTNPVLDAKCLAVTPNEKFIAIGEENTILIEENPLISNFFRIVGKKQGSPHKFMKFILDCQKESPKTPYDDIHNHWVVAPYLISPAHILAYCNRFDDLNKALFNHINTASFFSTVNNETPISICVNMEYKNCIDICLKYIRMQSQGKRGKTKNVRAYLPLANCLTKLNTIDYPYIKKLYDSIFVEASETYLPRFCLLEANLPSLYLSEQIAIYPETMSPMAMYKNTGRPIKFSKSTFPLDIDLGTNDSIEFLQSLLDCSDPKVFRTTIVQEYLKYKWVKIKPVIYALALLYVLYLILLGLHIVMFLESKFFLAIMILAHLLLLAFEILQIATDFNGYWFSAWNILDQLRSLSFSYYALMAWQGKYNTDILLAVLIFSWTKGISCFRVFDETRYMVRLIIQVIIDIATFFFLLGYATLAFAFVFYIRNPEAKSFAMYLTVAYRLDLGDFDTNLQEPFDWILFFISTMINPLIMLNLLIAIMSDTATYIAEIDDICGLKELTEMIIDIEKILFWKKLVTGKHYLQKCDFSQPDDLKVDKTEHKVKLIKKQAKAMEKIVKEIQAKANRIEEIDKGENLKNVIDEQENIKISLRNGFELSDSLIQSIQKKLELLVNNPS